MLTIFWALMSFLSGIAFLVALYGLLKAKSRRGAYYLIFFLAGNGLYSVVFAVIALLSLAWDREHLTVLILVWGFFYSFQTISNLGLAWYLSGLIDERWIYQFLGKIGISTDE